MGTKLQPQIGTLLVDLCILVTMFSLNANFDRIWPISTRRGFFCDDQSLGYPLHRNTVTHTMLYAIGFYVPLLFICSMELGKCYAQAKRRSGGCSAAAAAAAALSPWRRLVFSPSANYWPAYSTVRFFLFGYAAERLIKNIGKQTIGRLRPHFFAVCQPIFSDGSTCADQTPTRMPVYHMAYECQGMQLQPATVTKRLLQSAQLSFPSGHTSLACYGMTFIILYMQQQQQQQRQRQPNTKARAGVATLLQYLATRTLLLTLLQLCCALAALFVALSRVLDYKHHWSDVVAGALLGVGVAFVVAHCVSLSIEAVAAAGNETVTVTEIVAASTSTEQSFTEPNASGSPSHMVKDSQLDVCIVRV